MKTLRFIGMALAALALGVCVAACGDDDDDLDGGTNGSNSGTIKTESTVTLETAGTLSLLLGDKVQTTTSLKINGPLNGDDIICLRQMLRCTDEDIDTRGMLTVLDLSDASIVAGGNSYYKDYYTSDNKISSYMFRNCESLEKIALPNSVTRISSEAFENCTGLTQVNFNATACTAGYSVFNGCAHLSTVNIGNNVTTIPGYLFSDCTGLTQVTIGNSVTTIGNDAFYNCTGLNKFEVAESNEYYCAKNGVLFSKDMTTLIQFPIASSMTSYSIPNSVTSIGYSAFRGCTGLTQVTIGNSVTEIGSSAFSYCTGLTEVTIPESVTEIGSFAFRGCTGLTQVTIGNSVTTIGSSAFRGCTGLKSITSLNPTPPSCDLYVFSSVPTSTCVLYVPAGSKEAYSSAYGWKDFKNIVEI